MQTFPFSFLKSAGGAPAFDPATLALTGWWRASYAGSPWTPTASAGSSASNGNLTEATNPPATGAAVNGYTGADFDGTNDKLASASSIGTFLGSGAYSIAVLAFVDVVGPGGAPDVAGDVDGYWGIGTESSGGDKAFLLHFDAGAKSVNVAITTGAWQLIQARYTGVGTDTIQIRVNGGSWSTTATAGDLGAVTGALNVGTGYTMPPSLDGKLLEIMTADSALSDGDFDNLVSYCNSRYALSL